MDDGGPDRRPLRHGTAQCGDWSGHGRLDRSSRLALHHPQTTMAVREEKIDLQTLLIAEMVKFLPAALVDLALQDLRGYVSFEQ